MSDTITKPAEISQGQIIAEQMIRITENCVHFKAGPSEFGLPVGKRHADNFTQRALTTTIAIAIDQALSGQLDRHVALISKAAELAKSNSPYDRGFECGCLAAIAAIRKVEQ